jgi:precorrin-6B C5,15-methyltransferase / cobalt-precorrin-6B C5,C15-methyltransferase
MALKKWLSVVGIGADGLSGLSPAARLLLEQAEIIVGGDRHLAFLSSDQSTDQSTVRQIPWAAPLASTITEILNHRGQSVCVLASGDPLCYGVATTLLKAVAIAEMTIIPAPSAFSLACARLGWSLPDVDSLSLCGRDPALLQALLYPGARLLILSAGRETPAIAAEILTRNGYGNSQMTILSHMGGPQERSVTAIAQDLHQNPEMNPEINPGTNPSTNPDMNLSDRSIADLNTIAVNCIANDSIPGFSRVPGLPDIAFEHDGQLTKREVRAVTLSALAPLPGQLLWDVGAGCGSIGIEWLRSDRRCRAIAIEMQGDRRALIAANAAALGVPHLQIVAGQAPDALQNLPQPDTIFIGGGVTGDRVLETCWQALRPGGRLVANAVTVEGEQTLMEWLGDRGGTLVRVAVQRAEPVGKFLGWKAFAPITQWSVVKSP